MGHAYACRYDDKQSASESSQSLLQGYTTLQHSNLQMMIMLHVAWFVLAGPAFLLCDV